MELSKKILACESNYANGHPPAIIDATGQICSLPAGLIYDELYHATQEVRTAKEDFPLLVVVDMRPRRSRLPVPDIIREPTKRDSDSGNLGRFIASLRKTGHPRKGL